jgi:RecA-family ATPase
VGAGSSFFDQPAQKGRVLYLALEDSPRRMKSRLQKQQATAQANVRFEFSWQPLLEGGLDPLLRAIDYHRYNLVIIDTLARALGYVDPNKQAEMNLYLGTLQRAAVERNMTILLIDHHRKGNGGEGNVIDDIIGATAKGGVLDVAWGLYRARGEKTATLKLTGRDIEERELAMRFDRTTGCWACLGDAETIIDSEQEQAVLEALKKLGAPTNREIADVTGQDRSNCFRRIQELIVKGKVRQLTGSPVRYMALEG